MLVFLLELALVRGFLRPIPLSQELVECSGPHPNCYNCTISEASNLVRNGGFELPLSTAADACVPCDDWQILEGCCEVINSGLNNQFNAGPGGSQFIDLDKGINNEISQTVHTLPGYTYELSFYYSGEYDSDLASTTLEIGINENFTAFAKNSTNWNRWDPYPIEFIGTGSTTITIRGTGDENMKGAFIDEVKIIPKEPQFQYEVTYFLEPNDLCDLCNSSKRCVNSETTQCYAYVKDSTLIPIYCWTPRSRFAP